MAKKQVKIGVNQGGGPPPGYEWSVWVLEAAYSEIGSTFSRPAYEHLVMQMQVLASEKQPSHCQLVSIDKVEDFYELREKGGVLGSVNARVFFGIDSGSRALVVLGGIKKQNDGPTPTGDKVRMRRRWRKFRRGEYGNPAGASQ